jgi:hypothetical protein
MPNKWVEALKVFNEGKTEWCIPRKGSKEIEEIRKFMNGEIKTIPKPPKEEMTKPPEEPIPNPPEQLKEAKPIKGNNNAWINHVRQFAINRGITYMEALKRAKATYKKPEEQLRNEEIPVSRVSKPTIILDSIRSDKPIIFSWDEIVIPFIIKEDYPDIYKNIKQFILKKYKSSTIYITDLLPFTKKYNKYIVSHYIKENDRYSGIHSLFKGLNYIIRDICQDNKIDFKKDIKILFNGGYNDANKYLQSLKKITFKNSIELKKQIPFMKNI